MTGVLPLVYTVDDDPVFLAIMTQVLKKFGIQTETFATSEALLLRMAEKLPNLCFIDLNMEHDGSGLELLKKLREKFSKTLPIIMATTEQALSHITHALESGATDYIFKPLNRDILSAKLLDYLQTPELRFSKMTDSNNIDVHLELEIENHTEILQIDELGMSISCQHLLPKGMVIPFEAEILQTITQKSNRALLTVVNSKLESHTPLRFQIDFEFDPTDSELLKAVRHWIVTNQT